MSFNDMTKDELIAVGTMFAVDLKPAMNKDKMISELDANGVDFTEYSALVQAEEEAVEEVQELALLDDTPLVKEEVIIIEEPVEEMVVVKMTRTNPRYDVCGYSFSKDHPFMLVKESDAEYLIDVDGGFTMATPKEIREYYAQ